ncbi:MAG: hypothetical protein ABWZ30_09880 [Jiangellaceae bacterium]
MSTTGWETRLYWRWILNNSLAFIALLTAVAVLVWLTADVLDLAVANRSMIGALLVATFGALLFGTVLGRCNGWWSASGCPFRDGNGSWPTSDRRWWVGCW